MNVAKNAQFDENGPIFGDLATILHAGAHFSLVLCYVTLHVHFAPTIAPFSGVFCAKKRAKCGGLSYGTKSVLMDLHGYRLKWPNLKDEKW